MITKEERDEIINAAVEKTLLTLPEVVGNLIMNEAKLLRLNRTFYEKFPEFAKDKSLVASVIEKVESDNPGLDYEKLLERAVPYIKERIKTTVGLDKESVKRPGRNLSQLQLGNGEL